MYCAPGVREGGLGTRREGEKEEEKEKETEGRQRCKGEILKMTQKKDTRRKKNGEMKGGG